MIEAAGFCHVFVGGRFAGELRSTSSTKLWIGSDFYGTVKTGNPSTEIYIGRNFNGDILPNETASLLWLTVTGFAPQASLSKIVDCGYTQFNASVVRSDVAPGVYPPNGHRKTLCANIGETLFSFLITVEGKEISHDNVHANRFPKIQRACQDALQTRS